MGTGIAAFFADRGIPVTLYDVTADLARRAIEKAADPAAKVPILMSARAAKLITPRSVDEYEATLGAADVIVEAVPEVMSLKKKVYDAVEKHRKPGSIIATNTSGLSVDSMAEGRSDDFARSFIGAHFFNPVRFMQLVEVIPGSRTAPEVVDTIMMQLKMLGKKPVLAKDTPNFIANRIGIFGMMKTIQLMSKYGFGVEAIDVITGEPLGAAKSATFRTADIVGLDTLAHVAKNAFDSARTAEEKAVFQAPAWLEKMLAEKMLGEKSGAGFYRKVKGAPKAEGEKGESAIEVLDLEKFKYAPKTSPRYDAVRVARGYSRPEDRVVAMVNYGDDDKVSAFSRELVLSVGSYALRLVGEIADDARAIDTAVKLGFGKDVGPIEALDAIGAARAKKLMERLSIPVPDALADAARTGAALLPPAPAAPGVIGLRDLETRPKRIVRDNVNARLVDLGDGVLLCEPDAKMVPTMNPVDDYVIAMMEQAHEEIAAGRFKALVIGNQAPNFCAGANLQLVLKLSEEKRWDEIREVSRRLQAVNLANRHAAFPVVTAPHGLVLGGGCEITLGGQVRVAYAELYCGLVEVGVGLVPAGGGCLFLLSNMIKRIAKKNMGPTPPVQQAFELIGYGKVSTSAADAMEKGFLNPKNDVIVFDKDEQIAKAKEAALARLDNFAPIAKEDLLLPGPAAYYAFEDQVDQLVRQGKLTRHGARIARVQARILTGGPKASYASPVSPETILELEREGFVELCAEKATQERMAYMLKNGKPLLN
jgi:3-hydroxyacyl-CoA dehydrogenase